MPGRIPRIISRSRRGGNAIEFALLLPIFVGILGFIIEYGIIFHVKSVATSAVWAGCRAGAAIDADATPDAESVAEQTIITYMANNALLGTDCEGGIGCSVDVSTSGDTLECELLVDYPGLTGAVITPDAIQATAVTLLEQQG